MENGMITAWFLSMTPSTDAQSAYDENDIMIINMSH